MMDPQGCDSGAVGGVLVESGVHEVMTCDSFSSTMPKKKYFSPPYSHTDKTNDRKHYHFNTELMVAILLLIG